VESCNWALDQGILAGAALPTAKSGRLVAISTARHTRVKMAISQKTPKWQLKNRMSWQCLPNALGWCPGTAHTPPSGLQPHSRPTWPGMAIFVILWPFLGFRPFLDWGKWPGFKNGHVCTTPAKHKAHKARDRTPQAVRPKPCHAPQNDKVQPNLTQPQWRTSP